MDGKLVSIIIPVYDVEDCLYDCIESVINQTYGNIEIILIDDGSPDNCPKICDEYAKKDNRIIVIHQKNGGLSNARNAGLDIAKGDYLFFLDSDDFIYNDCIELLLTLALAHNADIVVGDSRYFSAKDEIAENTSQNVVTVFSGYECCTEVILGFPLQPVVVWNKLIRTELFDGIRFPDGKIHEDAYITYKIYYASSKVAFTAKVTYYYRIRDNSIMRTPFSNKTFDRLGADEERIIFFKGKEEFLYRWSIKKYLFRLIEFYFNVKNSNSKEEYRYSLRDLHRMYRMSFLYKDVKKICSAREKIKLVLFFCSPYLYYVLKTFRKSNRDNQ